MNTMNTMNLFNLTFELEGREYSLNVNSEEEREKVKQEVNANSLAKYNWFKENTGEKHWVLYNTEMYEITKNGNCKRLYLHYKEDSNLAPVMNVHTFIHLRINVILICQ